MRGLSRGLSRAASSVLPLIVALAVVAVSVAFVVVPNLIDIMECSDGEVRIPMRYCSGVTIYSREFGEFNVGAESWNTIMVKLVEAPNNFADMALKYLRQRGFEISADDVYGFTMIIKLVSYRLVKTGVTTSVKLPNGTTIAAEVTNLVRTVLGNETLVIVGRNLTDIESPIYAVKLINGRPAAAAKLVPVLVNETRSEYVEDFSEEMASKLNVTIDKLNEYKVPTQMRRIVIIKEYRYKVASGDPDVLTVGEEPIFVGPIVYEKHSQITAFGIVFAEAVAKATAYFVYSRYYTGALSPIDQSYCSVYSALIPAGCSHYAKVLQNGGIEVVCSGKFVGTSIPPLFQITYCATAHIYTDNYGRELDGTHVCWWPSYVPGDCMNLCPVLIVT